VSLILPALLALLTTMALLPVLIGSAARLGIVDRPGARKVHERPVPRVGGIAIACGGFVGLLAAGATTRAELAFLIAAVVIVAFGVIDDRFDLDYRVKFAGQLIAAGIVIAGGTIAIRSLTLDSPVALPNWLALSVTTIFLVGITNAINLSDGLDGLAGGTTFLCLAALALLAVAGSQTTALLIAVCFAAAVLGFLRFNTHPAAVFMGDAGSQLLGFTVGVVAILATQNPTTAISATVPVLLLGIPILDTLSVIVQRIREGRSPFSPDRNHLHHRLLAFGFDHNEAVALIYAVQALLFTAAYYLRYVSDLVITGAFAGFCLMVLTLLDVAGRHHWRIRAHRRDAGATPLSRAVARLTRSDALPRWAFITASALLAVQGLLTVWRTPRLPSDLVLPAWVLLGLLLLSVIVRGRHALNVAEKAALYVAVALFGVLDAVFAPPGPRSVWLDWGLPIALAISTAVSLRLSPGRRFALTPLDLIVLFIALVVPNLPGLRGIPQGGAIAIAKVVILFYALELLSSQMVKSALWLRLAVVALIAGLLGRDWLFAAYGHGTVIAPS
jgi:UDP-GlcNAc:undecaprenyl-phosphate/decaprenyl-phosphate GlcNAc-1-phosphate transferase